MDVNIIVDVDVVVHVVVEDVTVEVDDVDLVDSKDANCCGGVAAVLGGLKRSRATTTTMPGWLSMPTWLFSLSAMSLSLLSLALLPFLLLEESKSGAEEVWGEKGLDRCS